jgi:hypothetical protein
LVKLIRIGGAVAGALLLIGGAYLAWSGFTSAGLLGAFPGILLFVIGLVLLGATSLELRKG